ncbi:MAG TPA: hypothetical protein VJ901_18925 [Thermoanaerobaculia bacterium]|nr:hypothetical protein [Thermoanaerobaculia bacterium]
MQVLEDSALARWLKKRNLEYYAKAVSLRSTIERWLGYVVHTFPHYTSHAVDHSDTVIWRMSSLLFKTKTSKEPVVELSAIEAYILIAAAYLHDAGMVVSDDEKARILASPEWSTWLTGPMQPAWQAIETLRRQHHTRVRRVMVQQRDALFEFSFHDVRQDRADEGHARTRGRSRLFGVAPATSPADRRRVGGATPGQRRTLGAVPGDHAYRVFAETHRDRRRMRQARSVQDAPQLVPVDRRRSLARA